MRKYVTQMLDEIQATPSVIDTYKGDAVLKLIFEYAFDSTKKMILPEGTPPYKPAAEPLGMTPTNMFSEMRRLYVFCRADLTPSRREGLFISMLEGCHPSEADVLIAIKDQTLHKKYPKITRKLITDAGFIPPLEKKAKESATS